MQIKNRLFLLFALCLFYSIFKVVQWLALLLIGKKMFLIRTPLWLGLVCLEFEYSPNACVSFLPQSKYMQVKMPMDVNVSVNSGMSIHFSPVIVW